MSLPLPPLIYRSFPQRRPMQRSQKFYPSFPEYLQTHECETTGPPKNIGSTVKLSLSEYFNSGFDHIYGSSEVYMAIGLYIFYPTIRIKVIQTV